MAELLCEASWITQSPEETSVQVSTARRTVVSRGSSPFGGCVLWCFTFAFASVWLEQLLQTSIPVCCETETETELHENAGERALVFCGLGSWKGGGGVTGRKLI